MRKGEDLTKRYRDNRYAIYIPSLQSGYAQFATKQNRDVRDGDLPKSFEASGIAGRGGISAMFATHPPIPARIQALQYLEVR